jgi:uncharacterized protein YecE (DUF72 family)
MPRILVGTSGWTYDGWSKAFYPEDIASVAKFQRIKMHAPGL